MKEREGSGGTTCFSNWRRTQKDFPGVIFANEAHFISC